MDIKGIVLPCVGSTAWRNLISKARKVGLSNSQYKQLVTASNIQHNGAFKVGKIKAQQLDKAQYNCGKGVGNARSMRTAQMASKHSRISASASFMTRDSVTMGA